MYSKLFYFVIQHNIKYVRRSLATAGPLFSWMMFWLMFHKAVIPVNHDQFALA